MRRNLLTSRGTMNCVIRSSCLRMRLGQYVVVVWILLNFGDDALAGLENVAVAADQPMSMKCSVHQPNTNASITAWTFVSTGSKTQTPIWSKGVGIYENFNRSAVVVSNSSDSMKQFQIRSMDFHFAGIHTCAVISAPHNNPKQVTEILYSAQAIVLDDIINGSASFNGSTMREREPFDVSCSIGYRGNWPPVIEWRQHREKSTLEIDTALFNCSTNQNSSFVASGLRSLANYTMNNTTFSCRVYFTNYTDEINTSAKTTTTARNIPDFNRIWVSPRISITEEPRNVRISPLKKFYSVGDVLSCSAEGSPPLSYRWIDKNTGTKLMDGENLTISREHLHSTMLCVAADSYGVNSTSAPHPTEPDPQSSHLSILAISLGILCVLLLSLIVLLSRKNIPNRVSKRLPKKKAENSSSAISTLDSSAINDCRSQVSPSHGKEEIEEPVGQTITEEVPVYAAVNTKTKKSKRKTTESVKKKNKNESSDFVHDGTEYADTRITRLDPSGSGKTTTLPPPMVKSGGMFEMVTYAAIDHDLIAPIPPNKYDHRHYHQ